MKEQLEELKKAMENDEIEAAIVIIISNIDDWIEKLEKEVK